MGSVQLVKGEGRARPFKYHAHATAELYNHCVASHIGYGNFPFFIGPCFSKKFVSHVSIKQI